MCDSRRRAESDWASLERWAAFAAHFGSTRLTVTPGTSSDQECRRALAACRALRNEATKISPTLRPYDYSVALVFWFACSLGNRTIPIQKRAFAVVCMDRLLDSVLQSARSAGA